MQSYLQNGPPPLDAPVPQGRWLHLETKVLKQYGTMHAGFQAGSRAQVAERLVIRGVTYGQLANADLATICDKAGVQPSNNREVMATRLERSPYPNEFERNAEARREEARAAARAAAARAAREAAEAPRPQDWKDCMKRLVKRAKQAGGKMVS